MKSFAALTSFFLILAKFSSYIGFVQAAALPHDGLSFLNVPTNLVQEYLKLMGKCNADNAAVRILDPMLHRLTFSNAETD